MYENPPRLVGQRRAAIEGLLHDPDHYVKIKIAQSLLADGFVVEDEAFDRWGNRRLRVTESGRAAFARGRGSSFGEEATGVERGRGGQFAAVPKCDFCGKPITGGHHSDTRVCDNSDGPGFYLCDRVRCVGARDALEKHQGLSALAEHYTRQRALNDGLVPNARGDLAPGEHLETRHVLAGAYRGRQEERVTLTHAVVVDADERSVRTLCRQPVDRMGDTYGESAEELAMPPTCPRCLERWTKLQGHTPNATIYGRKHTIRRGFLLVPQQMTGPGGKVYEVDLEYQVWDAETGDPVEGSRTIEGERHGDRLVVGDPHRDTRLFEYTVATQPTSESNDFWRGYQTALGDRQWHEEGKSRKYIAKTRAWWDGYNDGHRGKRDPNTGYTPNATVYYVWVLDYRGVPLNEGPYGPYNLTAGKQYARIGATEGEHDRAVSVGRDPESSGFEIIRRYRRGTGEQVL